METGPLPAYQGIIIIPLINAGMGKTAVPGTLSGCCSDDGGLPAENNRGCRLFTANLHPEETRRNPLPPPREMTVLAVLSDTHDNRGAIRKALELAGRRGADEIFHCGDLVSPATADLFRGWTLDYAQGNMDRDGEAVRAAVERLGAGSAFGGELHPERDGKRIALLHGNRSDRLEAAIRSGQYDFIFHGHTHRRRDERVGRTRVINPGALGGSSPEGYSFCIVDLESGAAEFIYV
jgi:putative phosphoesterase